MAKLHQGDVGAIFRLTIKENGAVVDVSTATTKQIKFRRPDGTTLTKTAAFTTTGADGQIQWTTVSGDLSVPGLWKAQAFATIGGWTGHSEVVEFEVGSVLV